jgi:hypothetical protein
MSPQYGLTMAILLGICLMNVIPTPHTQGQSASGKEVSSSNYF